MVRHYRITIYQKGANMANANTKTAKTKTTNKANKVAAKTKTTNKANKVAAKPTDQQLAAQAAQAALLVAMQADHASRQPAGQGSRHGRHNKPRMPKAKTVAKFANACLAAIKAGSLNKAGDRLIVNGDHIVGATLGLTWLKTQHGWRKNQTCTRSASVIGFTGTLYNASTDQRHVILAPIDPVAFAKDPAGYIKANLAAVIGQCS